MDKKQIIAIIKKNPKMSYEEIKSQAEKAGVSATLVDEALSDIKIIKKRRNTRRLIILVIIILIPIIIYAFAPYPFLTSLYEKVKCEPNEKLIRRCCHYSCVDRDANVGDIPDCAVQCPKRLFQKRLF